MSGNDTKYKIIRAANTLFAEKGYEGTSVRDIAQAADVNIASINYYFKNKLNLYSELMDMNCKWFEKGISDLVTPGVSTKDFIWMLYLYLIENGHILMNSFKIVLTDNIPLPEGYFREENCEIGPPGGQILLDVITKDLGDETSEDARRWAVGALFTHVIHVALVTNNPYVKERLEQDPTLNSAKRRRNIEILVDAVLNQVKNWDAN